LDMYYNLDTSTQTPFGIGNELACCSSLHHFGYVL
jgi:hypothetical protein